ncbi:GntR family transcriptional regulator [Oceanospirillaceae bacterium]|jgi:DNA-binding GntR family transcriptional regulator|nr:GntR family transcriptional regulator [Oceanospirillaceae bacterium]|tara:strand:- start:1455 stop:2114 length:660 start_codon:yes stop_codon:yes gene_type:complete
MISLLDNLTARERIDSIHHLMRERICLLEYLPLSVLRESQLAQEFGCSRTPVREAIKRLEFEGLVTSKNGVGTIVTEANFELLEDVYEMRLKIAELIGSMGVRVLPMALVDDLQALLVQAKCLSPDAIEVLALARINHQLHGLVCQVIGNSALRQLYDLYYYQTSRVWYQKMPQFWASEVVALVDELKDLIDTAQRQDVVALGYIKRNYIARIIDLLKH